MKKLNISALDSPPFRFEKENEAASYRHAKHYNADEAMQVFGVSFRYGYIHSKDSGGATKRQDTCLDHSEHYHLLVELL